ncbi:TIGR04141 family sporadically distributed protein [Actinokineospora terrae]|uniref:TIGR04141 family sporadically distributed protein n=1 Tax=Actinokineospora terrae TaxID=155974 RepID=UPI0015A631A7|nr:TIGR04141 family sporadically distributed protein [Actinokineospora terrae]
MTIYRLRAGLPLVDYLKPAEDAEYDFDGPVEIAGLAAYVSAGVRIGDEAHWAGHPRQVTGLDLPLAVVSPFTVLLVEVDENWVCAATWGTAARHLLDETLLNEGFGLAYAIRRLDPTTLRTVNSAALDTASRQTQTSYPLGGPLSAFPIEPAGEIVTRLAGPASLAGLTYDRATGGKAWQIRAGDSLHIQLGRSPEDFVADLRAICRVADSSDETSPLRFVNEVRPVGASHPLVARLEARLAVALGGDERFGPIGICWPTAAARAAEEADSFTFTSFGSLGRLRLDPDLDISEITERFARVPESARLAELAGAHLTPCADDQGEEALTRPITMRRWIAFETAIEGTTFCLNQGRWYEIGETAVNRVRELVAERLASTSDLRFSTWHRSGARDDEHRYCELVAEQQPGFLCLDKDFARTPMHPKLELADLIGLGDELVHVKWPSRATEMGHLFTQARASAWAQRLEPEALVQLRDKVWALDSTRTITTRPRTVVLAIGGRRWDVNTLFTLSQVGLLRLVQDLSYLGVTLEFANIPFVAKPKRKGAANQAA